MTTILINDPRVTADRQAELRREFPDVRFVIAAARADVTAHIADADGMGVGCCR